MDDLFDAIEHTDENKVKSILEKGQSPNIKGYAGITPLHLAVDIAIQVANSRFDSTGIVSQPETETIKLLLKYGANIYEKDEKGATALDWANELNFNEVVELFENFDPTIFSK